MKAILTLKGSLTTKGTTISLHAEDEKEKEDLLALIGTILIAKSRGEAFVSFSPSRDTILECGLRKLPFLDLSIAPFNG